MVRVLAPLAGVLALSMLPKSTWVSVLSNDTVKGCSCLVLGLLLSGVALKQLNAPPLAERDVRSLPRNARQRNYQQILLFTAGIALIVLGAYQLYTGFSLSEPGYKEEVKPTFSILNRKGSYPIEKKECQEQILRIKEAILGCSAAEQLWNTAQQRSSFTLECVEQMKNMPAPIALEQYIFIKLADPENATPFEVLIEVLKKGKPTEYRSSCSLSSEDFTTMLITDEYNTYKTAIDKSYECVQEGKWIPEWHKNYFLPGNITDLEKYKAHIKTFPSEDLFLVQYYQLCHTFEKFNHWIRSLPIERGRNIVKQLKEINERKGYAGRPNF